MATDEVLTSLCQEESRVPTLRLYTWFPSAVSIGYFQSISSAVNISKCREAGIDVVRRPTGGRAVLHDQEITYSICGSSQECPKLGNSVGETYRQVSLAFLEALKVLGIKAEWTRSIPKLGKGETYKPCFVSSSRFEIVVENKKLIGSAQRRFGQVFLQHGSIPLKENRKSLAFFLPESRDADRIDSLLKDHSVSIEELLGRRIDIHGIVKAIKLGFERHFKIEFKEDSLSGNELDEIQRLEDRKYAKACWNLSK